MTDPVAPWTHDRPWRNWNPGDLRPRHAAPAWPGQTSIDNAPGGPFAIFASRPDGWCALALWLLYAHDVLGLHTTSSKIAVFAPAAENDTTSYAAGVAAHVGENADPHDPVARVALAKAIAHWESYRVQWPEPEIQAGVVTLCDVRWPVFLAVARGVRAPVANAPVVAGRADPDGSADALNAAEAAKDRA